MAFDSTVSALDDYLLQLSKSPEPFCPHEERWIFCPPFLSSPQSAEEKQIAQSGKKLFSELSARVPTLYLVQHPNDFRWGAKPGLNSLYCPHSPELAAKALVSAKGVVSFRIAPLLTALGAGVPGLLITCNQLAKDVAESWGIPHLSYQQAAVEAIGYCFSHFSWADLKLRLNLEPPTRTVPPFPFQVCAITDSAYMAQLLGLIENLKHLENSPIDFHILALEDGLEASIRQGRSNYSFHFYKMDDLWTDRQLETIRKRSMLSQALSSKALLLKKVLERFGKPTLYLDSDLFFFRSPRKLFQTLGNNNVLLFPHYNDVLDNNRLYGLYNAGMLAVSPGAEPFLDWWAQMCLDQCTDRNGNYFWDQGYLDLAPTLFDGIEIYRQQDHNLGPWNLNALQLSPGTMASKGSYHSCLSDESGLFEIKNTWDQTVAFFGASTKELEDRVIRQQECYWKELAIVRFFTRYLPYRLHLPEIRLSARVLSFFVNGTGRFLLFPFEFLVHRKQLPVPKDYWTLFLKTRRESAGLLSPKRQLEKLRRQKGQSGGEPRVSTPPSSPKPPDAYPQSQI